MNTSLFFYTSKSPMSPLPFFVCVFSVSSAFLAGGCMISFDPHADRRNPTSSDDTAAHLSEDTDEGDADDGSTPNSEDTDEAPADSGNSDIDTKPGDPGDPGDSGGTGDPGDPGVLDPEENTVSYCEEANENDLVVLECGDGVIDSIDFASFGDYKGSCAGGDAAIGKCHFAGTIDVIVSRCLGKSLCRLVADKKEVFDDPCKKGKHRLIVEYTCLYDESCPSGSLKAAPGKCGCNISDYDKDGDGSADCNDECDLDPKKIFRGFCGCGVEEMDHDKDDFPDCVDECDHDPNKTEPGLCGCGKPDYDIGDSDGDGTINCIDDCPSDPNKVKKGICGCGEVDDPTDSDSDGKIDCLDECPYDPHKTVPGHCGCGNPEICGGYCEDTPGYKDPKGESCKIWDGDCLLAWFYGYTSAQSQEIKRYCAESCGLCWMY